MFKTISLSPAAIECLGQLFVSGPTWDGNICSKQGRSDLYQAGLCDRLEGFTFLTRDGVRAAIEWQVSERHDKRWWRKQNGA